MSAEKFGPHKFRFAQTGAGQIGGDPCLRKIGAVEFRLLHLASEKTGFCHARAGKIRPDGPDLIEHRAVELRAREFGPIDLRGTEIRVGKIKSRKIEPIEASAGEIGPSPRRLEIGLDLCPCHLGRGKHRAREIDMAHHVLGKRRGQP